MAKPSNLIRKVRKKAKTAKTKSLARQKKRGVKSATASRKLSDVFGPVASEIDETKTEAAKLTSETKALGSQLTPGFVKSGVKKAKNIEYDEDTDFLFDEPLEKGNKGMDIAVESDMDMFDDDLDDFEDL